MKRAKQLLVLLISYTLAFSPLQAASIEIDGSTATSLDSARNGVSVVNIANPNAQGLSHNRFKEYNVAKEGLILNNSRDTTVNTQLGGYIFGNRNLTNNAKVILNEVTSTSRTQLNGYTEVAGKRSDLVIANPNGISINGAGFINTSNITLSTGAVNINNGNIDSFNVLGGEVLIEGKGLDTSTQESTAIYTQYLKLNAAINAKKLNIKLGKNEIEYKNSSIRNSSNSGTTGLLLDSSSLGGMYANRILLVGTDKGLGVNLPPEVLASSGDIIITNDGKISLVNINAAKNVEISTTDTLVSNANVVGEDIKLTANNMLNKGLINAKNTLSISSTNLTNNKTIFSSNDMMLYTTNILNNTKDANIFAINNIILAKDSALGRTQEILNDKANIETYSGNINIYANTLKNISDAPLISTSSVVSGATTTQTDTLVKQYTVANILSANNLNLNVDILLNQYSLLSAANNIDIQGVNISNESKNLLQTISVQKSKVVSDGYDWGVCGGLFPYACKKYKYKTVYYNDVSSNILDTIPSTIQAGANISGDATTLSNANVNVKENQAIASSTNLSQSTIDSTTKPLVSNITVPIDYYGLFIKSKNPQSKYLIETNPEFANMKNLLGSEYMLQRIDYNPELARRKVGDAFYESKLVSQSIFAQTGRLFLDKSISSKQAQYKQLMDNALSLHKDLKLTPGIALSKEQIAALSKDIVWMQEQEVAGERVLVPVVYIANPENYIVRGSKIIAGKDIDLNVATLTNTGVIQAGEKLSLNAKDTITNYGGALKADKDINLQAKNDITNTSGVIQANNINLTATDGSIINKRYTQAISLGTNGTKDNKTLIGASSNIKATKTLNLNAAKRVAVSGSSLSAKDININASAVDITTSVNKKDFFGGDDKNFIKESSITHLSSNINTDNLDINAKENTNIKGSNVNVADNLKIKAQTVNIKAAKNLKYKEQKKTESSFFSGDALYSSTMSRDGSFTTTNLSSQLQAKNIDIDAKQVNIQGSNLSANADLNINADTINIQTSKDEHKEWSEQEKILLSFSDVAKSATNLLAEMSTLSLADTGSDDIFSSEMSYSKTQAQTASTTNQSSNLNAKGELNLNAKDGDILLQGSNLSSQDAMTLNASKDVKILSAYDSNSDTYKETSGYIKSSISTSNGIETELDLTLKDETQDKLNAVGSKLNSKNSLSINSVNNINIEGSKLSSQKTLSLQTQGELNIQDAKNQSKNSKDNLNLNIYAGGIPDIALGDGQLEVELGRATLEKIKETSTQTTSSKSSLTSNADIQLTSKKSIAVVGSDIQAKDDVVANADEDINIKEAKNRSSLKSDAIKGEAVAKFVVANEYAKIAYATLAVQEAGKAVEKSKKNYDKYKQELSQQKAKLSQLKADYTSGKGFIELVDVEEFTELVQDLKEDEKYYQANIVLATTTLATKTTALLAQVAKAAASSGTYGFSASIELDIKALQQQLEEYESKSIASNIQANNIMLSANNRANIQGSKLKANKQINIDAKETAILASQDNYNLSDDTQKQTLNLSIGTSGFSMSGSVDSSKSNTDATSITNSKLQANNININTKETTDIKGANLNAGDTLNINSKNLNIASLQDRRKTRSNSIGISAGFGGSGLNSLGANQSNANAKMKETIQTDLTASEVNINTKETTRLKGATIASIDKEGKDNNNLNLKTNTLIASSLNNTNNSKSTSIGIQSGVTNQQSKNINQGLSNPTTEINGVSTIALDYTNNKTNKKTKTLATLGSGNIQIADKDNSELKMLNTDIANNRVDIYNISSHKGLQGELDTRLVSEEGQAAIAKDAKEFGKNIQTVAQGLPEANNENIIIATIGKGLNKLSSVTGGIVPSNGANGGLVGNVPIVFGAADINQKVDGDLNSKNVYMNGMMNTLEDAKTGADNIIGKNKDKMIWHNPSHGFFGDLIESGVDVIGNDYGVQTGISKQAQKFQESHKDLNIYMHSQGNAITVQGAKSSKENGHTYFSYGSPIGHEKMKIVFDINRPNKNEGDYVANPLNIFNSNTWNKPGHATENYGAAKLLKYKESVNEE